MTNFFIFLIFYFVLFLSGRSIFVLISNFTNNNLEENKKIYGVPLYFYYPIIFLFTLGNLTLVFNFFWPISDLFIILLLLLLLPLNLLKPIKILNEKFNYINFLYLFILSTSSYSTGLSYDAGLYHLSLQNYIKSEKIVFGLGNFHSRLAFSSIFDYINSNFWIGNNLLLIHFVNLTFISFFFIFLTINVFKTENDFFKISSIFLFLYIFLDNFGFGGGRNGSIEIEAITKFDSVFAILFTFCNLTILNSMNKGFNNHLEKVLLLLFIVFSIQLRPTGLLIFLPLLILIFKGEYNFKNFILPSFFGLMWIIKNVIISSCMIYPIIFSCIGTLSWSNKINISKEAEILRSSSLAYNFDESILDWFSIWGQRFEFNDSVLKNFLISFLLILLINLLFFKKKLNFKIRLFSFIYLVILNIFWLVSVPDLRFGISIFSTSVGILAIGSYDIKFFNFQNKFVKIGLVFLVFLTILFVPRIENYKKFINEPLKVISYEAKNIGYIMKQDSYGYSPLSGEQCWKNIKCSPGYSPKVIRKNFYSFILFELK